jgi:hypothetical protein
MAKGKVTFRDTDKGWQAMKRRAEAAAGDNVVVGVFGEKANTPHPEGQGMTIGEIVSIHEFGEGNNHERSFIRETVDLFAKRIQKHQRKVADQYYVGKLTLEQALNQVGLFVQGEIRKRISKGIPPSNSDATIARKGSSKPLIDKGHLRAAVDYEVRKA